MRDGLKPAPGRVIEMVGGWASFTFDVDGRWIARFPRNEVVAASKATEARLLLELSDHVSFRVPTPEMVGDWDSWPYFVYRRIDGRAIEGGDWPVAADGLRTMLTEMHGFPIDRASEILGGPPTSDGWIDRYRQMWPTISKLVVPMLDPVIAKRVEVEYGEFIDEASDLPVCLVHNDLGPEHILVDERTHDPVGIIDFEDAAVGDPAIDFVPLRNLLGDDAFRKLVRDRDLGERVENRMRFYSWMAAIHTIVYGVSERVEVEVQAGLAGLSRRLESPF